jgi:hypothetical protein
MLRAVKRSFGRLLRVFTIVLLGVSIWTAYANVFADDTALRARAGELARTQAGCGDRCKVTGVRISRGMLEETMEYDMAGPGTYVVTCRRAYVVAGEHACTASKR